MKVTPNIERSEEPAKKSLLQKFDIPIDHLSYDYVGTCKDARELERILRILRSGEEGSYPDLIACTEHQLLTVRPESKLLRKQEPALEPGALEPDQWLALKSEIESWTSTVMATDKNLTKRAGTLFHVEAPVRSGSGDGGHFEDAKMIDFEENLDDPQPSCSKTVKVPPRHRLSVPRRPTDWSKYNVDQELAAMTLEEEREREEAELRRRRGAATADSIRLPRYEDVRDQMAPAERQAAALAQRQIGNEYFNAGDMARAERHYSASVQLEPTVAAYNNRALALFRQDLFPACISDCDWALRLDPLNAKALYRRACAHQRLGAHREALTDVRAVLRVEGDNVRAQELERQLEKQVAPRGRRMQITEILEDSNDNSTDVVKVNAKGARGDSSGTAKAKPKIVELLSVAAEEGTEPAAVRAVGDPAETSCSLSLMEESIPVGNATLLSVDNEKGYMEQSVPGSGLKELPETRGVLGTAPEGVIGLEDEEKTDKSGREMLESDKAPELLRDKTELHGNQVKVPQERIKLIQDKAILPQDKVELLQNKTELPLGSAELPKSNSESSQAKERMGNVAVGRNQESVQEDGRRKKVVELNANESSFQQAVVRERNSADMFQPDDHPHSSMFFLHTWSTLQQQDDMLQHAKLLNSIKPEDLPKAIGPALDQKMLSQLLACLDRQAYLFSPDMRLAYLANLVRVQRFNVAACFMGQGDFDVLVKICKLLFEQGAPVPSELVAAFHQ